MCKNDADTPAIILSSLQDQSGDVAEYSEEFAAMILDQEENGSFKEIDVDDMLEMLDRMILEAAGLGSVH